MRLSIIYPSFWPRPGCESCPVSTARISLADEHRTDSCTYHSWCLSRHSHTLQHCHLPWHRDILMLFTRTGHCPELACGALHWGNSLLALRGISTSQLWNSTLPSSWLPVAIQARAGACNTSAWRSQLSQTQLGRTQTPPLCLYCRRMERPNASPWLLHRLQLWSRAMVTILCQRAPDILLPFTHKRLRIPAVGAILYSYHFFRTTVLKHWGKNMGFLI